MFTMKLNKIAFILSLLGIQIAGYLTLAHLHVFNLVCWRMHGCDRVAQHPMAHGFGIPALAMVPTAAFGLLFFCAILLLCGFRAIWSSTQLSQRLGVMQWSLAFFALLASAWLTYLEASVIHAWCLWCLASAVVVTLLFLTTTLERLWSQRIQILTYQPGEFKRIAVILLVTLLLDSGAALALRRMPPGFRGSVVTAPVQAKTTAARLVPKGGHLRGNPGAPYTLVEFGDYACPSCQGGKSDVEKILGQNPKSLNYTFHYVPVEDDSGDSPLAPRVAEAASAQGKYWEMHDSLFAEEDKLNGAKLTLARVMTLAKKLGLDQERLKRDLSSKETLKAVKDDVKLSDDLKIDGAPTFFIVGPNEKIIRLVGTLELQRWFKKNSLPQEGANVKK